MLNAKRVISEPAEKINQDNTPNKRRAKVEGVTSLKACNELVKVTRRRRLQIKKMIHHRSREPPLDSTPFDEVGENGVHKRDNYQRQASMHKILASATLQS